MKTAYTVSVVCIYVYINLRPTSDITTASPNIERDAICSNWRESSAKTCNSLFNCISVTDAIEMNNPIAKGPLYIQSEFGAI